MSLYGVQTLPLSPKPEESLRTLAKALGENRVLPASRVSASVDGRAPDEGLALLAGYVAIEDPAVRQALLDVVLGIARINPHH